MGSSTRSFSERVRRNHSVEHATLHVVARDYPDLSLVGRSDWGGFTIYGPIDTEVLRQAAHEAYDRLRAGQTDLAVHPNCGTNLAVTGLLVGAAVLVGLIGGRGNRWRRWPLTFASLVGALTLAAPLGPAVQRHMTTNPDMEGVEIRNVTRVRGGRMPIHRVEIEHLI